MLATLNWPRRLTLDRFEDHLPGIGPVAEALFSPCRYSHTGPAGEPCRDESHTDYRYALSRVWNPDLPPAVVVMLNPSTADARKLDPTVTRCRNFARAWGCGGLVVLNAFALRSTDPRALREHPDPVGPDNDAAIASVLGAARGGPVVVAWGADSTLRRTGRGDAVTRLLHASGIQPQCLRLTNEGYPGHPLYVPASTPLIPLPTPTRRTDREEPA